MELHCPKCQTHHPETAHYCSSCGSPLEAPAEETESGVAPHSHTPLLHRLIPHQYAERLTAGHGAARSERRIVTTLFADIVDSTALAEKLDPEDVTEIVNGAFQILTEPVQRHDGTLARLMGDAILGLFGAPIAHEDDPVRACRAAIDIISGTEAYAAELKEKFGIAFKIRVGISTGLAVVGEVGTQDRAEYTAIGDAVNLAARLQSNAPPGGVFIDGRTRERISSVFAVEDRGDFQFKGKSEAVRVFQLVPNGSVGRPTGVVAESAPFVNRLAEREQLQGMLDACAAGQGGIVSLSGDAGIGKSRLLSEVREAAGALTWIEGRCQLHARDDGFWIVRDLLQGLLEIEAGRHAGGRASTLRDLLAEEGARSPADSGVSAPLTRLLALNPDEDERRTLETLSASQLRHRIGCSFCDLVQRVCTRTPIVMIWEDIHWIDAQSHDILTQLVPLTTEVPLLIITVARSDTPTDAVPTSHLEVPVASHHLALRLAPLDHSDGATLVEHLAGSCPVAPATRARILTIADGNPLCIEEMTRTVCSAASATNAPHVDVPVSVQAAMLARVDRLPPRERNVLRTAVVIGRSFHPDILERVLKPRINKKELTEALDRLQVEGFLDSARAAKRNADKMERPEFGSAVRLVAQSVLLSRTSLGLASSMGPPPLMFKHALMVEVVYQSLLKSERREIHGRVGAILEAIYFNQRHQLAPILLYHFRKGEVRDKTLTYLLITADHAFDLFSLKQAREAYERALEGTANAPLPDAGDTRLHVTTRLGDICRLRGEYAEALTYYERALTCNTDPSTRANIHYRMGRVFQRSGRWNEARRAFEDGLAALERLPETSVNCRLYLGLSSVHAHDGRLDDAMQLAEYALRIARDANDRHIVALSHSSLGSVHALRGNGDAALASFNEGQTLLASLGDQHGLAVLHNNLGCLHKDAGRWDEARQALAQSLHLFTQLGNEHAQARVHDNLGDVYYLSGDEERASVHLARAMEILGRIGADSSGPLPEMWQSGVW